MSSQSINQNENKVPVKGVEFKTQIAIALLEMDFNFSDDNITNLSDTCDSVEDAVSQFLKEITEEAA
jgi:hypothetical protein